tara:strand:- start:36 stop:1754 length:1719 start_codon:yes stop_codon:yes gene_type:complete
MADKSFGVKELRITGTGTPTIESPGGGNLNVNAATTTFSGAVEATGGFTINSSSTIHVSESTDAASGFNIPFLLTTDGGGGGRKFQVDNGNLGFRPSDNTLFAGQKIQSVSGDLSILPASGSSDVVISAFGGTSRGLGYFKFTTSGSGASSLAIANVAIGHSAGHNTPNPVTSTGGRNAFVGSFCGLENTSGQFNAFLGYAAGPDFRTGNQNVAIGYNAGDGNFFGSNNTYIGAGAVASSNNTSNEVVIGNSNISKFKIPGINFTLKDNGGTPTTGHVLTVDSSGEASFEIIPQEDGITSTSTVSNLSSASDVMVGLSMGNRIHLEDDGSNANIEISTGEIRNSGNIVIKTGRLNSGSSVYLLANGNNSSSGASIKIAHTTGKVLVGSQLGNYNIGGSNSGNEYNGFLFNLDGTMDMCSENNSSTSHINMKLRRRNGGKMMSFRTAGDSELGSISVSLSENITVYAGTSDYRIKENDVKITNSITRLNQLRPIRFNFKQNPSKTLDGFFAHEVQTVVPEAVVGTKDEVDSNNEPVLQGIDSSKLVPLLTAALQDAITEIENLKTRVAALEGS